MLENSILIGLIVMLASAVVGLFTRFISVAYIVFWIAIAYIGVACVISIIREA